MQPITCNYPAYSAVVADNVISITYNGLNWFQLPIYIRVGENDKERRILSGPAIVTQNAEETTLTVTASSRCWGEKLYTLSLLPDGISLKVKVSQPALSVAGMDAGDMEYTGADMIPQQQIGEVEFCPKSMYEASGYYLPFATHASKLRMYRETRENGTISSTYLSPPMFAFPFVTEYAKGSVAIGIAPAPGEYHFDIFRYQMLENRCSFILPYPKPRFVGSNDSWESPALVVTFGEDEIGSLASHAQWHYNHNGCKKNPAYEGGPAAIPRWWRGPFFCGWGEQNAIARKKYFSDKEEIKNASPAHIKALDRLAWIDAKTLATQEVYTNASRMLDELDLPVSAIIIDDKWQKNYGDLEVDTERWPDLRGFVEAEHKKGRRVMLWFKTWDAEGLTWHECARITDAVQYADPTAPAYAERVQKAMYKLLSADEGCYNCDGFKIDYTDCRPKDPRIETYDNTAFGVELLKRMLTLIHDAAKAVKPDALINCSSAHPYFAEVVDQVRLHDLAGELRNTYYCMKWRAELFDAAMPGVLKDTDSGGSGSHAEMARFMENSVKLGIPVMYTITEDSGEREVKFTKEDWDVRRQTWKAYAAEQDAIYAENN